MRFGLEWKIRLQFFFYCITEDIIFPNNVICYEVMLTISTLRGTAKTKPHIVKMRTRQKHIMEMFSHPNLSHLMS